MQDESTKFSSKIGAEIWGHRFKDGQRGPEYTLEFLNVFAGTGFSLEKKYYDRRKMIEFRQFVYEGEKEGAKGHTAIFEENKKNIIREKLGVSEKQLEDLQVFFKNLTIPLMTPMGKPVDRSWYAQMMYPLHESLLFSEVRVNRDKNNTKNLTINYERNFFARGGELYFLMLHYGTLNNSELRINIEKNMKTLLSSSSGVIAVINQINEAFSEYSTGDQPAPLIKDEELSNVITSWESSEYPTLPNTDLDLYKEFAEELNALLMLNIDIYEMFDILTSLITFQLHRYMIFQSEQIIGETSSYFIDCLEGQNKSIKFLAQDSYRIHETIVREAYKTFVEDRVEEVFSESKAEEKIYFWRNNFDSSEKDKLKGYSGFFNELNFNSLQATKKKKLIEALETKDINNAKKLLRLRIVELYMEDLSKTQVPIMKTLARDGQFIVSGKGSKARYVLHDNVLSALVYATLNGQNNLPYDDFLNELFQKYRIIIGEDAAKISGLYSKEGINLTHFRSNEKKMRQKLKQNGLLQEYSDATALVTNPYYN
ncbi:MULTISPECIES: hypothetical protein [Exiguobacterium]|uniref:Uncharacterized protein n=1 Tax=Exiguobacterium indicum TaxID=296995 RepID=A0A0V8GEY0_9BACL|nr:MULTISPECIES: hypothetical protein [Exiguobacterium]AHA31217.1 hypothetical protein U719_01610 [Exiguobacterium sp. MH3]KSU48828.1 hypothetical protein AS033_10895 [Exiguobacterium enclense]SDC86815.1 hypothetical protein SAMN05216342_2220 [Exiguobacterium enclense]